MSAAGSWRGVSRADAPHAISILLLLLAGPVLAQPLRLTPMTPIEIEVGDDAGPQALALAEVSGDGLADLLVIDRNEDLLRVLLGAGDGRFAAPVVYELDGTPTAVIAADLASSFASDTIGDVDGKVDVVVAHEDGFVELFLGRGDGTFDPPEQDFTDTLDALELIGVAVHDLDGNGRLDLVLLDGFDEVYFQCNEGGSFAPCLTDFVYTDGVGAAALALGDFDGDTHVDVAVASRDSERLHVVPGGGDGTFDETAVVAIPTGDGEDAAPEHVVAAELDGDDGAEFVVVSRVADRGVLSRIVQQDGATSVTTLAGAADLRTVAVADLTGDGALDALTAAAAGPTPFALYAGDGAGGFAAAVTPAGATDLFGTRTAIVGRVDGDARPDIVTLLDDGFAVQVLLNRTPACAGDCDGDGSVAINELLLGVNIAIALQPLSQCPAFDADAGSTVEINELIAAVRNALEGCG